MKDIGSYKRTKEYSSNAADFPRRAMPTNNLQLSTDAFEKHFSPQSIFSGCTCNAPMTIDLDGK